MLAEEQMLMHRVQRIHLIGIAGEAATKIEQAIAGRVTVVHATDMVGAVNAAFSMSARGETILLAPACASFDQFESYVERGTAFQSAVQALKQS